MLNYTLLLEYMPWSWVTFQHWTNMSKLSDTDWILEVPFSGRAISLISHLLVKNSRYTDLKAVNYTQFLGFGKDITLFVNSKYYSIVVLGTFEEFSGTMTSYITNIRVNFPSKPSKIFPCVSIGMWNHRLHCWICFLQLLLNFIHSRHELIDVLAKRKPN